MDDVVLIGYAVTAVVVLGGFIGVIMKFTQPINDLRVVIQKLNDKIDSMIEDANELKIRVGEHGKEIDALGTRVCKIETKIDLDNKQGSK